MDMEVAGHVRFFDLFGVDLIEPVGLADLRGDVVVETLEGKGHIAILFHLPVHLVEVAVDQIDVFSGDQAADLRVLFAVQDVALSGLIKTLVHEDSLDQVLYSFYGWGC